MGKVKELKVAFIHPDLGIGGAERLVLDVAGALRKQKHHVFFVTNHFNKEHAFEELKNEEYQVRVIGDWLPRSLFGRFQAMCAYIRMIYLILVYILFNLKEDQPDVFFVDLIPIAIPFLKWANQRVIYYCHHPDLLASTPGGSLKKFYRKPIDWLEMKSTSKADIILVNSEYTASIFKETFPSIKKAVRILYPTIATSYLETVKKLGTPKPINELIDIPSNQREKKTLFLSINRFHPAKGLDLALLSLRHLKDLLSVEEWENVLLVVAGGYDPMSTINSCYYNQLLQLAKEEKLDNVIFLKSPSNSVKAELLLSSTCLLYTPVNEHFGIVPLEAMAVGKPVIACNSGGPRETVDHKKTGFLCEPTPGSMAECMKKVIRDDVRLFGANGKVRLKEKFSHEQFADTLHKIISSQILETKKLN